MVGNLASTEDPVLLRPINYHVPWSPVGLLVTNDLLSEEQHH